MIKNIQLDNENRVTGVFVTVNPIPNYLHVGMEMEVETGMLYKEDIFTTPILIFNLEEEKLKKMQELNRNADRKMQDYLSSYPQLEIDSFPKKEREANAYTEDNTASVPYLTGLVGGDVTKIPALVTSILTKAHYSALQEAYIVGLRTAIKSATSEEELNGISVDL